MDIHIVTLEITSLIIAFDHYDTLVAALLQKNSELKEEHQKIRSKNTDHLAGMAVCNEQHQLKALPTIKELVQNQLAGLKAKDIHELVEKLEKDVKKIKKLYKVSIGNS